MYNQRKDDNQKVLINEQIRAPELRVVGPEGENLGVMAKKQAVDAAREHELDLIVISPKANPPVAKIIDYGKFTYEQKKKAKEVKAKSFVTETKNVQVKIGTSERDKELKAKRIIQWLTEGHRVKVDLFLWGRYKYMEQSFLQKRLEQFLDMVPVAFKLAEPIKKSPKGLSCIIERDKSKPVPSKEEVEQALKEKREQRAKPSEPTEGANTNTDETS